MRPEKFAITGGSGMVGTDLKEIMPANEHYYLSSKDYNLTIQSEARKLFQDLRPDGIIHLAATVGGIQDNIARPANYFDENILMNTFMVKYAHEYNLKSFIGILSTCIYPDVSERGYPMKEEYLHDGPPTATNFSYGLAKRSLAAQIDAYNQQYGTKYSYLIPSNLYGPNDHFEPGKSHFVAALIKKIYDAQQDGKNEITLFGTGKPERQFLFSDDLAQIIKICAENKIHVNMNVSSDECYSIHEIARIAIAACGTPNIKIKYDRTKPDGQMRKTVSNELLKDTIPGFTFTSLYDGIKNTFKEYSKNPKNHINFISE